MNPLDRLIPAPRLYEVHRQEVPARADEVWNHLRHADLAQTPVIRSLFALRSLVSPETAAEAATIRLDGMRSSPARPGFQILMEDPPRELAVGAIGKVWRPVIPFVHVKDAQAYAAFTQPGFIKVAWALHVRTRGDDSQVEVEVRVDATDDRSWRKFWWYFVLIGPFSRYIRKSLLRETKKRFARAASSDGSRRQPVRQ